MGLGADGMSTGILTLESARAQGITRLRHYLDLTKPKIAALELVTVLIAALLAQSNILATWTIWNVLLGTALLAAGASAFNQWLEKDVDCQMDRTAGRPLPLGRLSTWEVVLFAAALSGMGICWLTFRVNPTTALLGGLSWFAYVVIYTPLKRVSAWNTFVGAIAGALPILIGWAATGAPWSLKPWLLFLLVFFWQYPHFMAIAWRYRQQYASAGLKMLTVTDPSGRFAARLSLVSALIVVGLGVVLAIEFERGLLTQLAMGILALWQLAYAVRFARLLSDDSARKLLRVSVVYLPLALGWLLAQGLWFQG